MQYSPRLREYGLILHDGGLRPAIHFCHLVRHRLPQRRKDDESLIWALQAQCSSASCEGNTAPPNQALQRTAATVLVCLGVEFRWLPRPLSLGVRRSRRLRMAYDSKVHPVTHWL